jgi:cytidine deaminase
MRNELIAGTGENDPDQDHQGEFDRINKEQEEALAALLTPDGAVISGANVENASYGLTICAERNAVAHAVAQGERRFDALAVVTQNGVTPCGACRQVLVEFGPEMTVIVSDTAGNHQVYTMRDLLPAAFVPEHLR